MMLERVWAEIRSVSFDTLAFDFDGLKERRGAD